MLFRSQGAKKTWFRSDITVLRQDPASPHPREGAGLSTAVPLDANHNPAGAYLNEDRLAFAAGLEDFLAPGFGLEFVLVFGTVVVVLG